MSEYDAFLRSKAQYGSENGFTPLWIPDVSFDFQQLASEWAIRKGRAALFADCGLGKTLIELIWGENVVRKTNRRVLILTPLAVSRQSVREADKFGIEAHFSDGSVLHDGINITNYEKLHHFSPSDFAGVVCDESSAIKAMNGRLRAQVTEFLRTIPYRLLCTATPAPNDYVELGTSSEALGIMGRIDMLNRFFKNDNNTSDTRMITRHAPSHGGPVSAGWRFKGHAELPFWQWVSGWAKAGRKPSDFGPFSDDNFILPELIEREHIVEAKRLADGMLLPLAATNMREEREERRRTITERCEKAAELVSDTGKPFVIWCHLNDEGDLLEKLIPDALQVSGSDADEKKEEAYDAFSCGQSRGIITKQVIGGWGLNWQHCPHVVEFASHSFEQHYQGVRRCWRFGQKQPVINDIIATEGQRGIRDNMSRKAIAANRMFERIVQHMNESLEIRTDYVFGTATEAPTWL